MGKSKPKSTRTPKGGNLPNVRAERVADNDSEDEPDEEDARDEEEEEEDDDGDEEDSRRSKKRSKRKEGTQKPRGKKSKAGSKCCGIGGGNVIFLVCWLVMVVVAVIGTLIFVSDSDGDDGAGDGAAGWVGKDDDFLPGAGPPSIPSPPRPPPRKPPSPPSPGPPPMPRPPPSPPRPPPPSPPKPPPPPNPPPQPPGPPPAHPPIPPQSGSIIDRINARFVSGGKVSSELDKVGVLVHSFDGRENKVKPWLPCPKTCYGGPCWCADTNDRLSATLINAALPRPKDGKIPTYQEVDHNAAAGFVLSPYYNRLSCSYAFDAGSMNRKCHRLRSGVKARWDCVPGCWRFENNGGGPLWCDNDASAQGECAFKPEATEAMLELQRALPTTGGSSSYNEVIVDIDYLIKWLPHSIEAVFYTTGVTGCASPGTALMCKDFAMQARDNLMDQYKLSKDQVPLLVFDRSNWRAPFRKVG